MARENEDINVDQANTPDPISSFMCVYSTFIDSLESSTMDTDISSNNVY